MEYIKQILGGLIEYDIRDYTGKILAEETSLPLSKSDKYNLTMIRKFPEEPDREQSLVKVSCSDYRMVIEEIQTPEEPLGLLPLAKNRWLLVCRCFIYDLDCRSVPIEINEIEKRRHVTYLARRGGGWAYQEGSYISFWYLNNKRYELRLSPPEIAYNGYPSLVESQNLYTVHMPVFGAHLCQVGNRSLVISGKDCHICLFVNNKGKLEVQVSLKYGFSAIGVFKCGFSESDTDGCAFLCPSETPGSCSMVPPYPIAQSAKSARK